MARFFSVEGGDYFFYLKKKDIKKWEEDGFIEGDLLDEGEKPIGKRLKIEVCKNPEIMYFKPIDYHPQLKSWKKARVIKFICSPDIFKRLESVDPLDPKIVLRIFRTDIYIFTLRIRKFRARELGLAMSALFLYYLSNE